jgi:hypothetical protein
MEIEDMDGSYKDRVTEQLDFDNGTYYNFT